MTRAPLFVIAVTLVIVAGVGVALAATRGTRAPAPAPANAAAGEVAAPTIEGDVTPDQEAAKATPKAKPKPTKQAASHRATVTHGAGMAAHAYVSGDEKDCWDDCGSSAGGASSTVGIDDDGDGDGGDCGEAD